MQGVVAAPVAAKSVVAETALRVNAAALEFLTVTVFATLVVPAAWVGNVSVAGLKVSGEVAPPLPVPESWISCGEYEVPFVTSVRPTLYAIMNGPKPGYDVVRVVPLERASWQASRAVYILRRR